MQQQEAYPVGFTVDYPDRPLDRLTTALPDRCRHTHLDRARDGIRWGKLGVEL